MSLEDLINPSKAVAVQRPTSMAQVSQFADRAAVQSILRDHHEKVASETLRAYRAALASFKQYLTAAGMDVRAMDLYNDLSQWHGVSFGLVEGYKRWMIDQGYAVATVNARLMTIAVYVGLAFKGGYVPESDYALIKMIKGYRPKEAVHLDQKREVTRVGTKKAKPNMISIEQAAALKEQGSTKDRALLCLLIDHGFRCSEVAALKVDSVNMNTRQIHVYRQKVNNEGTQDMSKDVYDALEDYLYEYKPRGYLFEGDTERTGAQGSYGTRAINHRVEALGHSIGIGLNEGESPLSPHDLRHYWAWYAAYRGIPINRLRQAGGWSTLKMPDRYIGNSEVENQGMV